MQCDKINKKINAWIDNELTPSESKKIGMHLKQCTACRLEAEGINHIFAHLETLPYIQAPVYLARKTQRAFQNELIKPGLTEWWRNMSFSMRGAVCIVMLTGLLCGAVLCSSVIKIETNASSDPYQTLYASKGIL
ncbi:MAG: zf-HC2 domain-containing protein [Deltaproteobacteria bacterium]|nr:zf-HC2 domain-containing protein [Deltaproteobacteria bacterium]